MNKEPAIIVAIVLFVLNRIVDALNIVVPNPELLEAAAQLIALIIGALLVRRSVFTRHTIREAGLSPKEVQKRADNPAVPRLVEG